jgi:hypothetical protein
MYSGVERCRSRVPVDGRTSHLTSRCSRRLAGSFPPALMNKIVPQIATRVLARRG